jgi:hypothetical protein
VMPDEGYSVPFSGDEMGKYLEHRRKKDIVTKDPVKSDFVDKQLAKAIEYIDAELAKAPAATPAEKPAEDKAAADASRAKK